MPLLLLLLLIAVAVLVHLAGKTRRESAPIVVPAPKRPTPPRHQRVSDAELRRRADRLRTAIDADEVSVGEAVESLSRTCGVEPSVAAELLGTVDRDR